MTITLLTFIGTVFLWIIKRPKADKYASALIIVPSVFNVIGNMLYNFSIVYGDPFASLIIKEAIALLLPFIIKSSIPKGYQLAGSVLALASFIFALFSDIGEFKYICLAACSMLFKFFQIFFEKWVLGNNESLEPSALIVGESAWGIILSIFVFLPLAYIIPGNDESSLYGGSIENAVDGIKMMLTTLRIGIGCLALILLSFCYSYTSCLSSQELNPTVIFIADSVCSLVAFIIFSFFVGDENPFQSYSGYVKIVALLLYCAATLIINAVIKLPFFTYTDWNPIQEQERDIPLEETLNQVF